jgi:hypothetical protein
VITLDIQIAPQDWQAMFDDMTEMAGAFGQGGTGNPQLGQQPQPQQPQQANAALACVGKAVGGACTVGAVTGRCVAGAGLDSSCVRRSSPSAVARPIKRELNEDAEVLPAHADIRAIHGLFRRPRLDARRHTHERQLHSQHRRGAGCLQIAWRLDFAEFGDSHSEVSGQRFHGFKLLSLTSSSMDADITSGQKLADDLFEEAGVPVGRSVFARVFIDRGAGRQVLRALSRWSKFPMRNPMLASRISADPSGNLYKPQWAGRSLGDLRSRVVADKKTNSRHGGLERRGGLAVQALNASRRTRRPGAQAWKPVFNVDGFPALVGDVTRRWPTPDAYGGMPHKLLPFTEILETGAAFNGSPGITTSRSGGFGGAGAQGPAGRSA